MKLNHPELCKLLQRAYSVEESEKYCRHYKAHAREEEAGGPA